MDNLLKIKQKPDALITATHRITIGALTAVKHLGLKISDDIAIIGFTNSNIPDLINPTLTTVRLPAFEMGQVATELLIQIIESKKPVTEIQTRVL